LNSNKLPARCILNGLITEPIPEELSTLERQLIQKAKGFQTIIRLGTYTGKVPIYNATKALKGTSFFLPLPFDKTLETLESVGNPSRNLASEVYDILPDPQLFILIDGRPTKDKVVWQSLVDVNGVKDAVQCLKQINWLYKTVDEESINDAAKTAFEAIGHTNSTLLEKAFEQDVLALSHYTIRQMSECNTAHSDIDHYKMMQIQEPAIDILT